MSALTWVSEGGRRLDSEISARAGVSRAAAQKWLDAGLVLVDGQTRPKNHQTRPGEVVTVTPPPARPLDAQPEDIPLCIVYEDDALLVVDKPRGMVVHPAAGNEQGTLVNALLAHCGSSLSGINGVLRPGIVHRIDKDTSGLLVVAKTDAAHLGLSAQLEAHSMEREYRAVVHGRMRESEGVIDAPLAPHPVHRNLSCRLETGRTHQIRVHMASIGHPLAGDPLYGPARGLSIGGQCLHAAVLGFTHPVTGEFLRFVSPLPDYFEALLKKLPTL